MQLIYQGDRARAGGKEERRAIERHRATDSATESELDNHTHKHTRADMYLFIICTQSDADIAYVHFTYTFKEMHFLLSPSATHHERNVCREQLPAGGIRKT